MKRTEMTTVDTYYIVSAYCVANNGMKVLRKLGNIRGMSDNGQPGWTSYGGTCFDTYEDALEMSKYPYSYSAYDANYHGGELVGILKVITTTKTITETFVCVDKDNMV